MTGQILLVDDEPGLRQAVQAYLEDSGFTVQTASNAREGWEQLQQTLPDLVISDIMMPQVNGYQFLKQMREDPRFEVLPVVFLTARGMTGDRIQGYQAGCDAYLPQTNGGVVRVPARVPAAQGRAVPQRPSIAIAPPAQPPRNSSGTAARVRPSTPSAVPAPSLSVEQGAGVASVPELGQLPGGGESNAATAPNDAIASARRAPSSDGDNSEAASLSMSQEPVTPQANLPRIRQVQEAQAFFESRWQPQEGIQQTLEYRLVVAPDGTIARITPLSDTAETSVDRTGIPLTGEPFVSPIDGDKTALMRLVLSPDGSVQTFLEGLN